MEDNSHEYCFYESVEYMRLSRVISQKFMDNRILKEKIKMLFFCSKYKFSHIYYTNDLNHYKIELFAFGFARWKEWALFISYFEHKLDSCLSSVDLINHVKI